MIVRGVCEGWVSFTVVCFGQLWFKDLAEDILEDADSCVF